MRRLLILLAFVLAACSTAGDTGGTTTTTAAGPTTTAGATTTTAPPGFTVTSDDGMVTLFVPPEAMAEDPGITIERLDAADYPEDLAAATTPGSAVYALAPDGPTFAAPVTLTRRIPIEEFGEVAAGTVPVVTLITTTPDHQGWGYLGDLTMIRDGDDLVVSGTTTHFSRVASIGEQVHLEVKLVEVEDRFATEVGVDLRLQSAFIGADGDPLAPPATFTAAPTNTAATVVTGGVLATLQCTSIGTALSDIAFETRIGEVEDTASLQLLVTPQILGNGSVTMTIGVRQSVECLDPGLALTGRQVTATLQPDHPGGVVIVPGEEFGGGNSGAVVTIVVGGIPLPSPEQLVVGLIEDCDFSGTVSAGDLILPPVQTTVASPEGRTAVIPIYDIADYFVYAADGSAFGDLSLVIDEPSGVPLLSGIPVLGALFRGQGRFVSSIGVVGDADGASIFPVTTAETPTTLDRELIIFITPNLIDSGSAE